MTVNEYKQANPNKVFFLKGDKGGHVYSPIAVDGMAPEVYAAKVLGIGRMKMSGVTCLRIDYNFLLSPNEQH